MLSQIPHGAQAAALRKMRYQVCAPQPQVLLPVLNQLHAKLHYKFAKKLHNPEYAAFERHFQQPLLRLKSVSLYAAFVFLQNWRDVRTLL